eukprot:TRINITY_DN63096_c0_g1_i2.p1 TRINITY_DN63096_c0_g1~~TRINITY_DN63096_c0_g1_i2.p1  ORF type:complete len:403 (+),score=59.71 TRINITY_DN63096_c0_g1_i2:60-1268(+)
MPRRRGCMLVSQAFVVLLVTVRRITIVTAGTSSPPRGTCAARRQRKGAADRAWDSIEEECRDKLEANRTVAAMRCLEGHFLAAREPGRRDGDWLTTLRKLRHDAEMFTWLEEEGKVKTEVKKLWRGMYQSAKAAHQDKPDKVFEVNFQEQNNDRKLWQYSNNKAAFIDPSGTAAPKKTVRAKAAAFRGLEATFGESGRAVIDKLLTDKTLKLIRRYLQASTFYFYPRPGQHLLALLEDGLASPLLAQLADGLRQAMPTLLGPLPLTGASAWKADNSALARVPTPGVPVASPELKERSSDARVSVLIWTVPASALNGSATDALELRQRSGDDGVAAIAGGGGSEPVARIKYVMNRAVAWDPSTLEAVWTGPGWKSGFLKRGIHFVLNFGWGRHCDGTASSEEL